MHAKIKYAELAYMFLNIYKKIASFCQVLRDAQRFFLPHGIDLYTKPRHRTHMMDKLETQCSCGLWVQ